MMFRKTPVVVADRRSVPRWRTDERGTIWMNDRPRGCEIIDLSTKGARLNLGSEHPLPLRFELEFAKTGKRRRVQLVWQRDRMAAVQFDGRVVSASGINALTWFKKIWG